MDPSSLPAVNPAVTAAIESIKNLPKVKMALSLAESEVDRAMAEQVELCEIPSPTFEEAKRATSVASRMKAYGLTDVSIDAIGNVIGKRPGRLSKAGLPAPLLVFGAHTDSVFPAGTDVKVKKEGNIYRAPGIGDNCSGLRAMLQVLRCLETNQIETEGDIWFIGTVGEEGNGDIRGSKFVTANYPIDGFIAIDSSDVTRLLYGGVGAHRWRLSVDGPAGHSFSDFGKAPSAIHAVCLAGAAVAKIKVPTEPKTTFTIGKITGGQSVNTIAGHCEVDIDMRSANNDELLKVEKAILDAFEAGVAEENAIWGITDELKKVKLTKTQIGNRPAGARPVDCPVLQCARAAQAALGIPLKSYALSSTDANAPISLGIPASCLCAGGVGVGAHTLQEYFEMKDTHLGPELILLTALALVGIEGHAPLLPVREKHGKTEGGFV